MKFFRRVQYWLHSRRLQADLAEEMEFHRAQLGDAPAMGNQTLAREDARAVWIWPWLESVIQDIRYALRNLRHHKGFALIAILALGTTIGLNTSLFTVFNAVALRPWSIPDPQRVVNIFEIDDQRRAYGFSLAEVRYLASHTKTFSGIFAQRGRQRVALEDGKALCSWVSASYFSALGVSMRDGRGFLPEEDVPDAPLPVVVVTEAFWRSRLGSDPQAVGRKIRMNETPFSIVGITSADFAGTYPDRVEMYVPMAAGSFLQPTASWIKEFETSPSACCSEAGGRIVRGVSRQTAQAELAILHGQFQAQIHLPANGIRLTGTAWIAAANAENERQAKQILGVFGLMFAGVLMVLLLACANVGNLLLARAAARKREISVRLSLGASRKRIIRQLLTESLVLAGAAGILGLLTAIWLPARVFQFAVDEATTLHVTPDRTVLFFSVALSILTCFLFGLAPALHGTRPTDSRRRLRSILLSAQMALSVVLLVGASLLARGIQHARAKDPGFTMNSVSVATFDLPASSYDEARSRAFFAQLTRELQGTPLGLVHPVPLSGATDWTGFYLPNETQKQARNVLMQGVTGGYFDVLHIPVVAGRNLTAADAQRKVILVNETFARRYFDGAALGKTIVRDGPYEIVGIVKDAYTRGLDQIDPTIYFPLTGSAVPWALFPSSLEQTEKLQAVLKQIDPRARLTVAPLSDNLEKWLQASRAGAMIAEALGIFALTLATIGMFGVFAFWVEQRTQEIGLRMALGATPRQVIRLVLGASSRSVLIGLLIGFAGAIGISRLLKSYLFGVSPLDPLAYLGVAIVLAAAAFAATYVPARRATKIDPMTALRCE